MTRHRDRRIGYLASHQSRDACREALEARISNRPWFLTRQPLSGQVDEGAFTAVVDQGVADPEDVDRLWRIFFQTDYPPFGVMDMVGLDVVRDIETSYQRESRDPTDTPSDTLNRMIAAGRLGEKTGSGFYTHPNPAYQHPDFLKPSSDKAKPT